MNNESYNGNFLNDLKFGKGLLKIKNEVYEGEFKNELKHG